MEVRFVTRNVELVESIKEHMEKKLGKLDRFFDRILDTQVAVDFKRGMFVVEITSNVNGLVMRGEDYAPDLRKAFDKSLKNIERQVKRHKDVLTDRLQLKTRDISFDLEPEPFPAEADKVAEESGKVQIVKTKRFPVRVMTSQEAALQMDLLGHSFFVFRNDQSGDFSVVYRRREGGYGVLEPQE